MSAGWPAWASAPVEIVPADPAWPARAELLITELGPLLAPWIDGRVEHVGSTAVPGLPAKPIIDLMAPVQDLAATIDVTARLAEAGWELVPPELDRRPWRRLHVLPEGDVRLAHLHLVERDDAHWGEVVGFRDALRADPALAADYAELKRRSAEEHREDREAYTEAKGAFVRRVVEGWT